MAVGCTKLVIPHTGKLHTSDARLMHLAEFLGITCELLLLGNETKDFLTRPANSTMGSYDCLVVNAQVLKEWTGGILPDDFSLSRGSCFASLFVCGLAPDPFCDKLLKVLSKDRLHSVLPIDDLGASYNIASNMNDISGSFAGLSFGTIDPANDFALSMHSEEGVRTPISIGNKPFLVLTKLAGMEIVFLGSATAIDLDEEAQNKPVAKFFSQLMPFAMALRYLFGDNCWHPGEHFASFIIDDPLLRPKYGFLDYKLLLSLMIRYDFSTTIAFIPYNYRRYSKHIIEMFKQNPNRLGICYHGNDHVEAEFAVKDVARINAMIQIAEARMKHQEQETGLCCSRVMVFPQGRFSVEAMQVLSSANFVAAVNTEPHPADKPANLTLRETAQPAVCRYGRFPLFLRKYVGEYSKEEVAFNLFFGKPVLVVDHHSVFSHPETLAEQVSMINGIAPEIRWANLETAVTNSSLRRRTSDGTIRVRAYSRVVRVANGSDSSERFSVEWNHDEDCPSIEAVLQNRIPVASFDTNDSTIRVSAELPPNSSREFSLLYRNNYPTLRKLRFGWNVKAFVRRRLSEARDNYISKNERALVLTQALRRQVSKARGKNIPSKQFN
jgi:hypothetical protein